MKRKISLLLIFTILFTFTLPSYAKANTVLNQPEIKILNSVTKNGKIVEETSIIGDTYYYFEDNDKYTLTISKSPNNFTEIYKKYKSSPDTLNYTSYTDLNDIKTIHNKVIKDQIKLENQITLNNTYNETYKSTLSSDSVAMKVGTALENKYGEQYSDKYLSFLYSDEHKITAYLYEDMFFSISKQSSWDCYAGMAITAIGALASWPVTTVAAAFTLTSIGLGGYGIAKDIKGYTYNADANFFKYVDVKGLYEYNAGKTSYNTALVGDKAAVLRYEKTTQANDFKDNDALLERGLQNYINFDLPR